MTSDGGTVSTGPGAVCAAQAIALELNDANPDPDNAGQVYREFTTPLVEHLGINTPWEITVWNDKVVKDKSEIVDTFLTIANKVELDELSNA